MLTKDAGPTSFPGPFPWLFPSQGKGPGSEKSCSERSPVGFFSRGSYKNCVKALNMHILHRHINVGIRE